MFIELTKNEAISAVFTELTKNEAISAVFTELTKNEAITAVFTELTKNEAISAVFTELTKNEAISAVAFVTANLASARAQLSKLEHQRVLPPNCGQIMKKTTPVHLSQLPDNPSNFSFAQHFLFQ